MPIYPIMRSVVHPLERPCPLVYSEQMLTRFPTENYIFADAATRLLPKETFIMTMPRHSAILVTSQFIAYRDQAMGKKGSEYLRDKKYANDMLNKLLNSLFNQSDRSFSGNGENGALSLINRVVEMYQNRRQSELNNYFNGLFPHIGFGFRGQLDAMTFISDATRLFQAGKSDYSGPLGKSANKKLSAIYSALFPHIDYFRQN